jgi:hypothetical protein
MRWWQQRAGRRPARPGRRFTDVVEDVAAWVLTSVGALLLAAAVLSGLAAHADAMQRGRVERATRTTAEAVVLADVPVVTGAKGSVPGRIQVDAAWFAPDGTSHTVRVPAPVGAPAGSTVEVWIDRDGRVAGPPVDATGAVTTGLVVAMGLLLVGGPVLGLCWAGVHTLAGRANAARWEREWARVGPEWSRNPR